MTKTLFALAILLGASRGLEASTSIFTERPDDPGAVYLTADKFPVHGDGVADDSGALQQAIDTIQETTNQGILFLPPGRYRVTRTIYIWPGIRIVATATPGRLLCWARIRRTISTALRT
jgi:hypothetical protein